MFFVWILFLLAVSFVWAVVSLKKDKSRHEVEKAKSEIAKGRVIYYSSSSEDSSKS